MPNNLSLLQPSLRDLQLSAFIGFRLKNLDFGEYHANNHQCSYNLPQAIIQQDITELEDKLNQQAIMQIAKKCASLPTIDHRTVDEILGYEQSAMGLWGDK